MTFSIFAGHFELVVNPSQRIGVIGPSDTLQIHYQTIVIYAHYIVHLCTAVVVPRFLLVSFISSVVYCKYLVLNQKYLLCDTQVLRHDMFLRVI